MVTPICNFTAHITSEIIRDDGEDQQLFYKLIGSIDETTLPEVEVNEKDFDSMTWPRRSWGIKAMLSVGQSIKDHLRLAILLQSQGAQQRRIFTHTGWREVDGKHIYLTSGGALGGEKVVVDLAPPLRRYLLLPPEGDPVESIKTSLDFLYVGNLKVTLPLWTAMYLAPLAEFIPPSFTLWYVGISGSFKSVLTALALNHFGDFDYLSLPAAWRNSQNHLEKLLFLAKDIPMVIDDWPPGQDAAKARELEVKADYVTRAQGNRQGRGRMKADRSLETSPAPRGLLITSGEQLPAGHSQTSRIVTVEIEREDILRDLLSAAQTKGRLYNNAMAHYIAWISENWDSFKTDLPKQRLEWREEVYTASQHPRLPEDIASLYAGLYMASQFALEKGALSETGTKALRQTGWEIFTEMAKGQSERIEDERPSRRFLRVLRTMMDQGKAVLWDIDEDQPRMPQFGTVAVGWKNGDEHILLNPSAAYAAVYEYCQRSGGVFTLSSHLPHTLGLPAGPASGQGGTGLV